MRSGAISPSMPVGSRDGMVHDYVGGLADLEARRVRFIGDAGRADCRGLFAHPAVLPFSCRLWRGRARSRRLCMPASPRAPGLQSLSRERVRMELLKLLVARRAAEAVHVMADAGLLVALLGGVPYLGAVRCDGADRGGERRQARCGSAARRAGGARRRGCRPAVGAVAAVECRSTRGCGAWRTGGGGSMPAFRRRPPEHCSTGLGREFFVDRVHARLEPLAGPAGRSALA